MSFLLTTAAIVIAAALVRQTFFPPETAVAVRTPAGPPRYIAGWQNILRNGTVIGEATAPVKIVEFADLECPFCKRFHETTYPRVHSRYLDKVALVFVHFPLAMHRFAAISARAAECAAAQGRFANFVDVTYAKQDSLGLKSWASYAQDAGVIDTISFVACVKAHSDVARIDSGSAIASRLGVRGTPGILVNGWLFPQPPSDSILDGTIDSLLLRKMPFKGD